MNMIIFLMKEKKVNYDPNETQRRLLDELTSKLSNFNIDQKMDAVMKFSLDEISETSIFINLTTGKLIF